MSRDVFVWDTTGPMHATACGHAAWLIEASGRCRRHVIPSKVSQEMADHGFPADEGLFEIGELETIEDLVKLARWQHILGSKELSGHDEGEAWVAALAQKHDAVAIIDDQAAQSAIKHHSTIDVHGVLWAISRGVVEERVSTPQAYSGLCDAMLADHGVGQLRWPFTSGGYAHWYNKNRKILKRKS